MGTGIISAVTVRSAALGVALFCDATVAAQDRVIYGEDDRLEVYETADPTLLHLASATCAIVDIQRLQSQKGGGFLLQTSRWEVGGFVPCDSERFASQQVAALCSAFLVGPDTIITAGHCLSEQSLSLRALVFGFQMIDDTTPRTTFEDEQVYFPIAILAQETGGPDDADYSVIQLDRAVTFAGAQPLDIRRFGEPRAGDELAVAGFPGGLPMKIIVGPGNVVRDPSPSSFLRATIDTFGGNSGSPVLGLESGLVEGLLVRGQPDFVFDQEEGCFSSNVLATDSLVMEEVQKTTYFGFSVPGEAPIAHIEAVEAPSLLLPGATAPMTVRVFQDTGLGHGMRVAVEQTGSGLTVEPPFVDLADIQAGNDIAQEFTITLDSGASCDAPTSLTVVLTGSDAADRVLVNLPVGLPTTSMQTIVSSAHDPFPIGTDTPAFSGLDIHAAGEIARVTVRDIRLRHSYDADLDLALESPSGSIVLLSDDNGGNDEDYWMTSFAKDARFPVRLGSAPFTGVMAPEGNLGALAGEPAAGLWVLRVYDDALGDAGELEGWSLELETVERFCDVGPVPVVQFLDAEIILREDHGEMLVPVALGQPAATEAVVTVQIESGTAIEGEDFILGDGSRAVQLIFEGGSFVQHVPIEFLSDSILEIDESLVLRIDVASGCVPSTEGPTTLHFRIRDASFNVPTQWMVK